MANALKKIITAAKKIHKKGGTWKGAVKKASVMYRGGKLKAKRKRSVGAVKKTRKRSTRKKSASRRASTKKATRTVVVIAGARRKGTRRKSSRRRSVAPRRRVSGSGKDKFIQTLVIGGLAVGLIVAFTRNRQQQTAYVPTGDQYRDSKAQQILSYATAAGATIAQISNLIKTINQSSNAQLDTLSYDVQSGAYV